MAPEYVIHGQFSVKSDVFSFGVLTLEIVSGQRNSCFQNGENEEYLLSHVRNSLSATQVKAHEINRQKEFSLILSLPMYFVYCRHGEIGWKELLQTL